MSVHYDMFTKIPSPPLENRRVQDMLITINACFQGTAPACIKELVKMRDNKYDLRGNNKNEAEQTLDTVIPWPCTEECFVNVLWILNVLWMFSEFCIYIEHIFQSLESSWEHPLRNTVRDNIPRVTLGTSQVLSRRTRERPPVRSWTPLQNPLPFGLPTLQTFRHFWIFMRGSS